MNSTDSSPTQAPLATGVLVAPPSSSKEDATSTIATGSLTETTTTKMEPLEVDNEDEDEMAHDTESLLPGGASKQKRMNHAHAKLDASESTKYFGGLIQPQKVGNMLILFPEQYFEDSQEWGVVGPNPMGPVCVWLLLCVITHMVVQRAMSIGIFTVLICYGFFCNITYRLVDVSLRDPGICFYHEIPEGVSSDEARQWRWCDLSNSFQPPDGAHCLKCDVCVEGYDHFCLWIGTCIGKKNYKQFMKFNVTWLWFLVYYFVWVLFIGHFIKK